MTMGMSWPFEVLDHFCRQEIDSLLSNESVSSSVKSSVYRPIQPRINWLSWLGLRSLWSNRALKSHVIATSSATNVKIARNKLLFYQLYYKLKEGLKGPLNRDGSGVMLYWWNSHTRDSIVRNCHGESQSRVPLFHIKNFTLLIYMALFCADHL